MHTPRSNEHGKSPSLRNGARAMRRDHAHRAARGILGCCGFWLACVIAAGACACLAASAFWRFDLVGKPFNHSWHVDRGAFVAEWLSPQPDGTISGFGNPGPRVNPQTARGVEWRPRFLVGAGGYHELRVPLWPAVVLSGIGAWMLRGAARRAVAAGHCGRCGYDLRGLAPGAACPECGARATLAARVREILQSVLLPILARVNRSDSPFSAVSVSESAVTADFVAARSAAR